MDITDSLQYPWTPFTPEVRHEWNARHESTGNNSPWPEGKELNHEELDGDEQWNPEDECIKYMDNIVENFRWGEVTKLKALSQIISILDFNPSRTEEAKGAAVEYYARTLGEVKALTSSVTKWGEHAATRLQTNDKDVQWVSREQDDAIDELISQISQESNKPKWDLSPGWTDPDDDFREPSNKKRRVFESEMPWFDREEEAWWTGNKDWGIPLNPWSLRMWLQSHQTMNSKLTNCTTWIPLLSPLAVVIALITHILVLNPMPKTMHSS